MKNVRKLLITALSVMLFVCLGLFAAACDDGDEPVPAEKVYYTVTVAEYNTAQGTVTLDPAAQDGKYEENTSVTVTATPNGDYEVEAVKANGSALTANGEGKYVFTVSGDTTVAVTFKAKTVTPPPADEKVNVTVTCGSEGSYTLDPAPVDGKVAKGASVTLTVTPNANYEVDSVKVNGSAVTANGEGKYVFTANADTTVEITFKAQGEVPPVDEKVNVTVTCGENGSYTLDPAPVDGKVAKGASVTLTVTPAENYEVDSVKVNNSAVELQEGNTYTFTADADTTVEITFKEVIPVPTYTVTYALGDHAAAGAVVPAAAEANEANGYKVTLPAAPAAAVGYRFVGWQVGGETEDAEAQITVSESITVTAVWEEKNFNQYSDVPVGKWGTVLPRNYLLAKGDAVVLSGSFTEKATTDVYQGIVTQVFAGGNVESGAYYFFRPDCPAHYDENGWKYWAESGCTWSTPEWGADSYKAETEGSVVVTVALSDAGVLTVEVAFTGTTYSYTNLYTVSDTMESALIFFAADGCTPAAASVKHYTESDPVEYVSLAYEAAEGSVTSDSLSEDGKVASGTEVTLTIEPAYGYEIVSVTVNGDDVTDQLEEILLLPDRPELNQRDHSPKRTLALGAVTADTEVAVTFQQATHKITFQIEGPGSCELFDSTVSLAEQTALKNLTAVPSATKVHAVVTCESYVTAEFHVKDGTRDLKMSIVSGNTYFWVVDKDLTVTVTFTVDREKAPQHNVTVTGGENGKYELTPKGGYPLEEGVFYGDGEATITLTPNVPVDDTTTDTYIIDALKIKYGDSEETDVTADLVDGSYTFPVTGDVELSVSFKKFEAVTSMTSAYNGTWNCTIKGESATTSLSIQVTTSRKTILIKEGGLTTVSGTAYTATLGYTVYVEGGEDSYVIYLVPGLNNKVLSLTLNGDSVTYYLKSGTASAADATIEESYSIYDSSWYGGAASMPIKFEFGKVSIDGVEATRLAKSVTDEGIVYTVYANGGLYELIWTEEDDSLVLHPYGKSTADDVPYTRETPPDPTPVPQYAGTYSNNEHTVVIDETGAFTFDGTPRNLYYEAQTRDYYFKTSTMEYTVQFTISGSMKIFNAAAKVDWTLNKIEEGTAQYTLTVNCENGTVAYSPKNAEMKYWAGSSVTITITANKHFEVEKITINNEDKAFTNNGGTVTITVTMDADTTVDVTFKELKEENLLSDLYIGVYTYGTTTVTITSTGVTLKDTNWTLTVTFTDAQITHTGEGQFTLQNGNRKFTFTFTEENTKLKVTDPNWAMGGSTKTLTKQS